MGLILKFIVLIVMINANTSATNHNRRNAENERIYENRQPYEVFIAPTDERWKSTNQQHRLKKPEVHRSYLTHHPKHNHHIKKHRIQDDDWGNVLLTPLEKKYPSSKLRQLYKRTLTESQSLPRTIIYNSSQSPKFELPQYQHFCDEDVSIGTKLLQVKVVSLIEGENVTYSLSNNNFTIDNEGNIRTAQRLDADFNGALYTFNVTATGSHTDSPGLASARIYTTNKNDESPVFSQEIYPARVDENAKSNAVVATVVATDKDGDQVKYSLSSVAGMPPDMFVIHPDTGVIRLGPAKTFEKDSYELNVTATDDGSCCVDGGRNIHTGHTLVIVSIIDVNDHKPNFTLCGSYQPSVKENEPVGTSVIVVSAVDEDRGENGRVEYEYVSKTGMLFTVDQNTGLVTTSKRFDREGDDGKFVPITITARDNGSPALEGVCLFKVIIEDVNDNKPMFDRKSYEEKLKQSTPIGADVLRLSATDDDADNNARIGYSLESDGNDPEALNYFSVDADSGWVSLTKILGGKLDYRFIAIATDKGEPPLSNRVEVVITIVNKEANPPSWNDVAKDVEYVKENENEDTPILKIGASSGIANDRRVTYKLIDGNTAQTNKRQNFYQTPDTDDAGNNIAVIKIRKSLDYEDVKEYNLTLRAENTAGQSTEKTVHIKVTDVNDEIPQFTDHNKLSVLEGKPIGSEVGQLNAIDKDSTQSFSEVTFELVGPASSPFRIDSKTGKITTNAVFDREMNQTIQIRVKIKDGAPSDRRNMKPGEPNSDMADFNVYIGDINDNDPVFEKTFYQAEVNENEDNGHVVTTVQAIDKDESSKLNYEITEGNIGGAFSIKAGTGAILVAGNLDYESDVKLYTLTVTVSDGLHENTTKVEIKVLDLNDNPPKFVQSTYETTIWERDLSNTTGLPEHIVTVSVTDADESRPKEFVYFLTGQARTVGPNGKESFEINNKGEIVLNVPLDRDLPNGRPTWRFNVFAQDEGGKTGSLDGYAEVVVHLRDINDNAPSFPDLSYVGSVNENLPEGSSVMIMAAIDNDDPSEGGNAILTYEILSNVVEGGKNIFKIDPNTALITTNVGNLDRERIPEYVIQVLAKDGGGLTGTGTATISIGDVNDSPPRFEKSTYNITITETYGHIMPKDPILVINVLDDDLPKTNNNYFQIVPESGPGYELFNVVVKNNQVSLMVTRELDFENEQHRKGFSFQIKVSDMGANPSSPDHIAFCTINILITDVNDNPPKFDVERQNVSIKEDAPVGTSISKFHATDADNFGKSKISYAIDHATNRQRQFIIDGEGTVTLQRQLDRETNSRHALHILAIDDGAPSKTSTAALTVNVLDVNDNAPHFKEDYRPVVPENEEAPLMVIEVEAYDPDDYAAGNGPPFKFALAETVSTTIRNSFRLEFIPADANNQEGSAKIYTKVRFDREEQKEYLIPIVITDSGSPPISATNTLTVIIGDKNDNPMRDGSTDIFVYNYKGKAPEAEIGRVYVDDKDDWDLPDKTFQWKEGKEHEHFKLLSDSGTIIMKNGTRGGSYMLYFHVTDSFRHEEATASANITVKEISEKAVFSSGSIRMAGITEEEFISVWDSKENKAIKSKYDIMRETIAERTDAEVNNVDLFTVKKKLQLGTPILDIRFSAHGSPFYKPEKVNGLLSETWVDIEKNVGVNITLIGIDECIYENVNCESSCSNELVAIETPYVVNANRSSLAGVNSEVVAVCTCRARNFSNLENCGTIKCFNGGTCLTLPNGNSMCYCPSGFSGPRCQKTSIGFEHAGYAWFPPFQQCEQSHFSLEFITLMADGLLFYNGPVANPDANEVLVRDFISLELADGFPRLLIDFGSGTLELKVEGKKLNDEEWHTIDIFWAPEIVTLVVDYCEVGTRDDKEDSSEPPVFDRSSCAAKGTTPLFNEYLNVNAPLQIGGVAHPKLTYSWEHQHSRTGFIGCIKNVMLNSELYDLGTPAHHFNSQQGCPLTQEKCRGNDVMPFCGNGTCVASKSTLQCDCKTGFMGDRCELESPQVSMDWESYIKYNVKFQLDDFKTGIMLRFRTFERFGELFHVFGKDFKEYLILEIRDGHLLFQFNLRRSGPPGDLWLTDILVTDGQWHSVYVSRYGSRISIALDGGEGRRYNETLRYEGLRQLIDIKTDEVFVGGHFIDGILNNDFKNSCISDVRFDSLYKQLPIPPVMMKNKYADAESVNVQGFCPEIESCLTVLCPDGMNCNNFMGMVVCSCLVGYVVGREGLCVDYNECDDFPCKNGGTCENTEGSFICHCPAPHSGTYCNSLAEGTQTVALGSGALAAILICALALLLLALILVVYSRKKKTSQNNYLQDDPRENIINYDEEGGGEEDMNTYDLGVLRAQLDGMPGSPMGPKPGPEKRMAMPLTRAYSPGSEPDVVDFINNNLGKANEDPDAVPTDDLRNYAFEGAGSTAGSLSSLASGTDDNEQDFDYLNNWGPRFQKLADMYGQGESEEE